MTDDRALRDALRAVFIQFHDVASPPSGDEESAIADFQFHMTDWVADLGRLSRVYESPDRVSAEQAGDAVYGFLVHAVPHLMAAYRAIHGEDPRNIFADMPPPVASTGVHAGEAKQ